MLTGQRFDQLSPATPAHLLLLRLGQLLPLAPQLGGDLGDLHVGVLGLDGVAHVLAEEHVRGQAALGGVGVLLLLRGVSVCGEREA